MLFAATKKSHLASRDTETHKVCSSCNELLTIDNFYKDGTNKRDGTTRYRRDCKECYKASRMAEYMYKKGREE